MSDFFPVSPKRAASEMCWCRGRPEVKTKEIHVNTSAMDSKLRHQCRWIAYSLWSSEMVKRMVSVQMWTPRKTKSSCGEFGPSVFSFVGMPSRFMMSIAVSNAR